MVQTMLILMLSSFEAAMVELFSNDPFPFPQDIFDDMQKAERARDDIPGWVPEGDPQIPVLRLPLLDLANVGSFFLGAHNKNLEAWAEEGFPWEGKSAWKWGDFYDLVAVGLETQDEEHCFEGWAPARLVGTHRLTGAITVVSHVLMRENEGGLASIRMFPIAEYEYHCPGLEKRIRDYLSSCLGIFNLCFSYLHLSYPNTFDKHGSDIERTHEVFTPLASIVPENQIFSMTEATKVVSVIKGGVAAAWGEDYLCAKMHVFDVHCALGSKFIEALYLDVKALGFIRPKGQLYPKKFNVLHFEQESAKLWRKGGRSEVFSAVFDERLYEQCKDPEPNSVYDFFGEREKWDEARQEREDKKMRDKEEKEKEKEKEEKTSANNDDDEEPQKNNETPDKDNDALNNPIFKPGISGYFDFDRLEEVGAPSASVALAKSLYKKGIEENNSKRLSILADFPWAKTNLEGRVAMALHEAQKHLNDEHVGMDRVKERVMEELAMETLKGSSGRILCFVGPPGTGKSSMGKSMAKAMGRPFIDISLAGSADVHVLRGFASSWGTSEPGIIVREMLRVKDHHPLILLDEVDKISQTAHGNAFMGALLDLLDPGRNDSFMDEFLGGGVDMSGAFFVLTANDLSNIPAPLRDRMDIIEVGGYTPEEKKLVVKERMLPAEMKASGLPSDSLTIDDDAVLEIIHRYTHESGLRSLKRLVGALCRKVSVLHAKCAPFGARAKPVFIHKDNLEQWMDDTPLSFPNVEGSVVGQMKGLAATGQGGCIIPVECSVSLGGAKGHSVFMMTGEAGVSLTESSQAVLSVLRERKDALELDSNMLENGRIHIHLHGGKKDGPSAGLAMALTALSALSKIPIRRDIAVTGALGLDGTALAVGGLDEKIMAAARVGCRTVLVPEECRTQINHLRDSIRNSVDIHYVKNLEEAWTFARDVQKEQGPKISSEAEQPYPFPLGEFIRA